jgi:hypothetical protein
MPPKWRSRKKRKRTLVLETSLVEEEMITMDTEPDQ